jgi:hypothetical protein
MTSFADIALEGLVHLDFLVFKCLKIVYKLKKGMKNGDNK